MNGSSPNNSSQDVVDETLAVGAGLGIITMALFPLAIPMLALTALALIPLLRDCPCRKLGGGTVPACPAIVRLRQRQATAQSAARPELVGSTNVTKPPADRRWRTVRPRTDAITARAPRGTRTRRTSRPPCDTRT